MESSTSASRGAPTARAVQSFAEKQSQARACRAVATSAERQFNSCTNKQPFAQFGDGLSLNDRLRMYSRPMRLSNVNGRFRERRSLCSESSRSAASLHWALAQRRRMSALGRKRTFVHMRFRPKAEACERLLRSSRLNQLRPSLSLSHVNNLLRTTNMLLVRPSFGLKAWQEPDGPSCDARPA